MKRKTITITVLSILAAFLLTATISCNNDTLVDEAFTVTVSFFGNGATEGEMPIQTAGKGISTRLNANTFGRFCFIFTCWNTEADGTGTSYVDNQSISFTENTTLYAQWELQPLVLSEEMTSWVDGGYYLLDNNATFEERITVSGNVTLILSDGYILTASKGISVNEGNSLTIEAMGNGTGTLNAFAMDPKEDEDYYNSDAAIGSEKNNSSGLITINGGTVNVTSESYGAAIGGGREGSGTVIINGGIVTVTSLDWGAGIGGGCEGSGTVTINGGIVTVISEKWGAGIGGGSTGSGTVTINGGTVTVTSEIWGAGIGGGSDESGTVTINGGTVTSESKQFAAGIGGGCNGSGTVIINDGTVNASTKGDGAGIGGGSGIEVNCGTVTINGGTVEATAENDGAGIGGGYRGNGGTITINGGIVTAGSGSSVGSGRGNDGINDGTLTLGEGVSLEVSSDNIEWSAYDGSTRKRYMRTI